MLQIFKRGRFLAIMLMLLCCLSLYAADDDLITKKVTVKLDKAGTLPNKISFFEKYDITNLKIIGEINGTDLEFIKSMAHYLDYPIPGKLSELDLSEAKFVSGGDYYDIRTNQYNETKRYYTHNDEIGDYAFYSFGCLKSLTLPSHITAIGNYAFEYCGGLTSLTIPTGVTKIGYSTFRGCSSLTSLNIPSGVTSIGAYAFERCSSLTSLNIPSGVTSIGAYALKKCSSLTSLNIPYSVISIGGGAFSDCCGLTSIYVYAEKVPKMEIGVFNYCDAKKCTVYVPKGTYDNYRLSEFGYFENIVEFDATGIDKTTTSTNVEEVSRYSADGQRLAVPVKGLNIVKYSDGTARKVVVK